MKKATSLNPEVKIDKSPDSKKDMQKVDNDSAVIREVVEGTEVSEFIESEVSESMGEGKKKVGSGMKGNKSSSVAVNEDSAFSFPILDVMRIQISTKVKKEIVELEKEASLIMSRPGKFDPFHLNRIVARIRYLRDFLSELAYATTEKMRILWQKYVKGGSSF